MKKPKKLADVISKIIHSGIPDVLWFLSNTKQPFDDDEILSILVTEVIRIERELIRVEGERMWSFFLPQETQKER